MKKYIKNSVINLCLSSSLLALAASAHATTVSSCSLGGTCHISANEAVYFIVTPSSGNNYECVVTADRNTTAVIYGVDGSFIVDNGLKYSVIETQKSTINFKGHFINGNNSGQPGYLLFGNSGLRSDASVRCNAIS